MYCPSFVNRWTFECAELHVVNTGKVIDDSICHPHLRDSIICYRIISAPSIEAVNCKLFRREKSNGITRRFPVRMQFCLAFEAR